MIQSHWAMAQPTTPPSSPNLSLPKALHPSDFEVVSSPFVDFERSENLNLSMSANTPAISAESNVSTHNTYELIKAVASPPNRQDISPSKFFVALSDAQELVKAVIDMQLPSSHVTRCTCSYTPPEDPSEATLSDSCSKITNSARAAHALASRETL